MPGTVSLALVEKMVLSILMEIGLKPSECDPCLFVGVPSSPGISAADNNSHIHIGLYADDFVYLLEDNVIEQHLEWLSV